MEGRTVADTGLDYEIDYRKEIITFDPDVVEAGKDYTLTDNLPSGGTITPGTTLYVRLVDDGTGNSGPVVMEIALPVLHVLVIGAGLPGFAAIIGILHAGGGVHGEIEGIHLHVRGGGALRQETDPPPPATPPP